MGITSFKNVSMQYKLLTASVMEWIGMRKLAGASSLSDVSNVVYYSDEYWASFMNFPKMQYCTMQVTLYAVCT